MNHLKQYEEIKNDEIFNIGDYIRTYDAYTIENGLQTPPWHDQLGIVKNIGYRTNSHDLYLIQYTNELDNELKNFISINQSSTSNYNFYQLESDNKQEKYDEWFCSDYIIKITKEEHDKAMEEMEIKKSANNYNL